MSSERLDSASPSEADDYALVTLTLDDGTPVTVEVSRREEPGTELNGAVITCEKCEIVADLQPLPGIRLQCTDGAIEALQCPGTEDGLVRSLLVKWGYLTEVTDFVTAVRSGGKARLGSAEGRSILASYHSTATGEPVALPFSTPRDLSPYELWRGSATAPLDPAGT